MDSMRSATSPSGTPRHSQTLGTSGFTDYRGSSLFSFGVPFSGPAGSHGAAAAAASVKEEAAYGSAAAGDEQPPRRSSGLQ